MTNDDLDLGATLRGFTSGQRMFDRYCLNRQLGRGGMGVVWLAHDETLDRDVALKFLPEEIAQDADAILDMKRETRRALELTHPRIVRIYDFVDDSRRAAVSMEYVDGPTLSSLRRESPTGCLSVEKIAPWVEQLSAALTYAHNEAKIAHRDLKPANLMIDSRGTLKVTDFGISATLTDSTTRASRSAAVSSGTPVYMSPQQMMGEKPQPTDDIYSLGATIYELLTGRPPFFSGNIPIQVQNKVPPTMTERRKELGVECADAIPESWEKTVAACLAKESKERPQSAAEVWDGLNGRGVPCRATSASSVISQDNLTKHDRLRVFSPRNIVIASVILTGAVFCFWWFGFHVPEVRRQEIAARQAEIDRQEAARRDQIAQEAAEKEAGARAEAQRIAAEAQRIAAAIGGVTVVTKPSGAEVQIGTETAGKTPFTLKSLKLGQYPVHVRMEGYENWNGSVEVKENTVASVEVGLTREVGSLQIDTEPSTVQWKIVGKPEDAILAKSNGASASTLGKLPTGEYTVEFSMRDWPVQQQTVLVNRGETTSLRYEFAYGLLVITSNPSGAGVTDSNGHVIGTTPYVNSETKAGDYNLVVGLNGYHDVKVSGHLKSHGVLKLSCDLVADDHSDVEKEAVDNNEKIVDRSHAIPDGARHLVTRYSSKDISIGQLRMSIKVVLNAKGWKIIKEEDGLIVATHDLSRTWAGTVMHLGNVSDPIFYFIYDSKSVEIYDLTDNKKNESVDAKLADGIASSLSSSIR